MKVFGSIQIRSCSRKAGAQSSWAGAERLDCGFRGNERVWD